MLLAVLSDLHLGAKDPLDRFQRTQAAEAALLARLRGLEAEVDRVIFLGDVFETLRGKAPGSSLNELKAAMDAYPELSQRLLNDRRYQWVHGNHDHVGRKLGAADMHQMEADGLRYVFFHGHQVDQLARGNAPLSRMGVWLGATLERVGIPVTQKIDHQKGGAHHSPGAREYASLALGRALGADVVVTGHTHRPMCFEHQGQTYLNSGTWLAGRREFVRIDTQTRKFDVVLEPNP